MKASIYLIFFFFTAETAIGQVKDSIGFVITKAPAIENANDLYDVRMVNFRKDPICVMHSTRINLIYGTPQRLALQKSDKGVDVFSLHYVAEDTLIDYEMSNPNYNAEPILPHQEIRFQLLIPVSEHDKMITFEYLVLPEFCYESFEAAIFRNATTWYGGYKKMSLSFALPKN